MNHIFRLSSFLGLALALLVLPVHGNNPTFHSVGASQGIGSYQMAPGMGGGVVAADYDNDGDIDFFVPTAEDTPNQLYRNLTSQGSPLQFEEIASQVGLASLARSRSALWFDANGDGRLDLVVAGDCFQTDCVAGTSLLRFYQQSPQGQFEDRTQEVGLFDDAVNDRSWRHRGGLSAGDIDNDGDPDLFSTMWLGGVQLYLNEGNGTFRDISHTLGSLSLPMQGVGPWQALFYDFDQNGLQDIFVAVDFAENYLLMGQPNRGFVDKAQSAGLARAWNGMGTSLGDIDNDGDLDLYVTNISDDFFGELRHSNLYRRNDHSLEFQEISEQAGVDDVAWGWGVTFFDANNNGWLDLGVTNGFNTSVDASRFFLNQSETPGSFTDASDAVGFNDMEWGSALIASDLDRDGDLDMIQTCSNGPLRVLENRPLANTNRFLTVIPRTTGAFPYPLGAVVTVEVGTQKQTRLISAGTSFMAQEPAEAFFGLGPASQVDTLTIIWPLGGRTILTNVATNQVLTVTNQNLCYTNEDVTKRYVDWPQINHVADLLAMLENACSSAVRKTESTGTFSQKTP